VEEQAVESVRNAEGGTLTGCGKLGDKWTSQAGVAKGRETLGEARLLPLGRRQETSSHTLRGRCSAGEDHTDFVKKSEDGVEGKPPSRWKQGARGGSR
jgi:hypothetical protein